MIDKSLDWSIFKIEDICDILDSQRIPINSEEREKRVGEVQYYGANGLQGYIDDYIFDEPLILMAEDGGRFEEYATRPIAYRIYGKSWVNNHAHVLRAKKQYCQDFIFYSLEHKDIQSYIVGGTRSKLNQSELRKIEIRIPELRNEQSKIAEILEKVDSAIEKTEELILKQERIKTGLMQDLLAKGIDEHGNIRSEETHEFKDSPIGRIPKEWSYDNLQNRARVVDSLHKTPIFSESGHPMVRVTDIKIGKLSLKNCVKVPEEIFEEFTHNHSPQKGDIVLTRVGTYGISSIVCSDDKFCIGQNTVIITDHSNSKFLYEFLQTSVVREYFDLQLTGSSQKTLSLKAIRETIIPILSPDEMNKILLILEEQQQVIEFLEVELEKNMRIKTALMQDLLTGEKRVTSLLDDLEVTS